MATPTFLLAYIRRAKKSDFSSIRAVITGAEKLNRKIVEKFSEKFGIVPLEGYGATELSPVASINIKDVKIGRISQVGTKDGTIGHPLPGMCAKVVDTETQDPLPAGEEGLLLLKGPNVMLGYLDMPEKTQEVLSNGWYNTGDIVKVDRDGFITITDRMSRYSKIGGEMVPHIAIEDVFVSALDVVERVIVVTSLPDEKKGEQIVVLYTESAGDRDQLYEIMKMSDLPNLWKPKKENYFQVLQIPLLGSGKLDMGELKRVAKDLASSH